MLGSSGSTGNLTQNEKKQNLSNNLEDIPQSSNDLDDDIPF